MKKYIKPTNTVYNVEMNEMLCMSMSYSEDTTTGGNSINSAEVNQERLLEDLSNLWNQGW